MTEITLNDNEQKTLKLKANTLYKVNNVLKHQNQSVYNIKVFYADPEQNPDARGFTVGSGDLIFEGNNKTIWIKSQIDATVEISSI